ncbi:hypothetical protein TSUD_76040 [Trifolium subterraneum]|nr:hypothetical protein TSUD_76040 [Trifolium subterraneum]
MREVGVEEGGKIEPYDDNVEALELRRKLLSFFLSLSLGTNNVSHSFNSTYPKVQSTHSIRMR